MTFDDYCTCQRRRILEHDTNDFPSHNPRVSIRKTYAVLRDPCFIATSRVLLPRYLYCPMGNCCGKPATLTPRPPSPIPLEGGMVMVKHTRPTPGPPSPKPAPPIPESPTLVHQARAPPVRSSHSLPQSVAESSTRNSRTTSILGDRASTLSSYQQRQRAQSAAGGVSHRSSSSGEGDGRQGYYIGS